MVRAGPFRHATLVVDLGAAAIARMYDDHRRCPAPPTTSGELHYVDQAFYGISTCAVLGAEVARVCIRSLRGKEISDAPCGCTGPTAAVISGL